MNDLKLRTKKFAVDVYGFLSGIPSSRLNDNVGRQLLRSATSVGANYRAVCRAKSRADFLSKMGTVEEEVDECAYWLEFIIETKIAPKEKCLLLLKEAGELASIAVASIKTARKNKGED